MSLAEAVRPGAAARPARAKLNLALHVVGRRADGYHLLDSLVAFAEVGDRLRIAPAPGPADALDLAGPFGPALPAGGDNLVLRALAAGREVLRAAGGDLPPHRVVLEKNLPPASGIGGGSADAAAVLAHLAQGRPDLGPAFRLAGLSLGADVPMCLDGVPARVSGIGEVSAPLARLAPVPVVLVNCGRPVSTPDVFRELRSRDNPPLAAVPAAGFPDAAALAAWLAPMRNDLQPAAQALVPEIDEGLERLDAAGARLARMSGSGATVFALFDDEAGAKTAAAALRAARPHWWVAATRLSSHA